MEENFLFLDSLGNYSAVPEGLAKLEAVRDPDSCGAKTKPVNAEHMNSGYELFRSSHPNASPDIIVKIEPEEEPCVWEPKQNGETELGHDTSTIIQHEIDGDDLQLEESSQSLQQAERERQRNVRFSEEENDVLINSIMPHYDRLFGKLAARNSTAVKNALWREIVSAVNAISAYPRSVQNCKKRYADIKRKVKDKLSKIAKHRRATGGGAPLNISFWPYERVMEKMISADIVAGVPGATDSGRGVDQYYTGGSSEHYLIDSQDLDDDDATECDDFQMVAQDDTNDQDYVDDNNLEIEEERSMFPEDTQRETHPEAAILSSSQEQIPNVRRQTIRDHTTLIYAEQSHFRRTMARKLDILNNNVKVLNRNVKAFQKSFNQSIGALSETLKQQNGIFEKLSSNLLLMAEQQQQHNRQCMNGMQHVLSDLRTSRRPVSPSDRLSEASSTVTTECVVPLEMHARRGAYRRWRRGPRSHKTQDSSEQMSKKSRH